MRFLLLLVALLGATPIFAQDILPTHDSCNTSSVSVRMVPSEQPDWNFDESTRHPWITLLTGPEVAAIALETGASLAGYSSSHAEFNEDGCIKMVVDYVSITLVTDDGSTEYIEVGDGVYLDVGLFGDRFIATDKIVDLDNPEIGFSGYWPWLGEDIELLSHPYWIDAGFTEWHGETVPEGLETYDQALEGRDPTAPVRVGLFMNGELDYVMLVTYNVDSTEPSFHFYLGNGLFVPPNRAAIVQQPADI